MNRFKTNIVIFICMLAGFTALVTLFPADALSIERENRAPNALPALTAETALSKEFADALEPYLSDKAGYRGAIIGASQALERLQGFAPGGVRVTNNTLVLPNRMLQIFIYEQRMG